MSYRVGDVIFSQSAAASVVVGRDETNSALKCDKDFKAFQVSTRHGLLNGMAPESREQFNNIMDEVVANKDNKERVDMLRGKMEELMVDPKNFKLVQYLDGEVRHLMNMKGVKPRYFTTEELKVR
jgi:hypothetical protein